MQNEKNKWVQPQLIILGRGAPEENVLQACKTATINASGGTKKKCQRGNKCAQQCKVPAST